MICSRRFRLRTNGDAANAPAVYASAIARVADAIDTMPNDGGDLGQLSMAVAPTRKRCI